MDAILIDSEKREIKAVKYNTYRELERLIGVGAFYRAWNWDNGDVLFIDWDTNSKAPKSMFVLADTDKFPLPGNGVVCGAEVLDAEGLKTRLPPTITVEELAAKVTWCEISKTIPKRVLDPRHNA